MTLMLGGCAMENNQVTPSKPEQTQEERSQQTMIKKYDRLFGVKNNSEDKMMFLYQNAAEKY